MLKRWWRRFRQGTRWVIIAGWLCGCGTTRATIDPEPAADAPVVVVEGQQAGSWEREGIRITWDSRRESWLDRMFDAMLVGNAAAK